jgi:hypothetical protein
VVHGRRRRGRRPRRSTRPPRSGASPTARCRSWSAPRATRRPSPPP